MLSFTSVLRAHFFRRAQRALATNNLSLHMSAEKDYIGNRVCCCHGALV